MGEQIKNKKVWEAPDGGWGYLIGVAAVLNFALTSGVMLCFGQLYKEFIEEFQIGAATVVLISASQAMSVAVSGFLTSPLLKVLSFRKLAFVACTLYNFGCLGNVFANSVILFFVSLSVLQGFGFGILFNLTCTILNEYFVKRRFFAMGIIQTFTALFIMCFPLLLNTSYELYGQRGTLIIVLALSLNLYVAIALMQPVKWHMKLVELPVEIEETKSLLVKDDPEGIPTIMIVDVESKTADKILASDEKKLPTAEKKDSALKNFIKETFDITLLKTFVPTYSCVGVIMAMFADFVTSITLPQTLYAADWTKEETAIAISMMSFGDLAARTAFICTSKCIKLMNKELHMIGVVIAILPRIGFLITRNFYAVLSLLFLMGVSRCFIFTLIPLIVGEAVPQNKFTSAMGMSMLIMGISNLSLGPAVGAVRDLTGSYDTIFWVTTIVLVITFTLGLLETHCLKRSKTRSQDN